MAIDLFQADELVSRANVNQRLTDVTTKFTSVDTNISTLTPVQLYYNASGSTGTIELSQSIVNFKCIEIHFGIYALSGLWQGCTRLYNDGGDTIGTGLTLNLGGTYNSNKRLKAYGGNTWAINDGITRSAQTRADITGTNTSAVAEASTDAPAIYRVIGYKY